MLSGTEKNIPDYDLQFRQKLVYRSMSGDLRRTGELLGAGFMHKDNIRCDSADLRLNRYVMVIVLRGRGVYIDSGGTEYPLTAGMYFQRLPWVPHSLCIDPGSHWAECYLETGEKFAEALQDMQILKTASPVGRCAVFQPLVKQIWEFMHDLENAPENALPLLAGKLIELFHLARDRSKKDENLPQMSRLIEKACRLLGTSFADPVDLKNFCREHGCGYENFRKQFKKEVGLSPVQYRVRRRLDAAAVLLREKNYPVARIADILGYSSAYEFSAQFKRKYGQSPRSFRGGREELS